MCGKYQAPLLLLLIWAIKYNDIYMISALRSVFVINFHIKFQFKGVIFINLGPHIAGHLGQMGVCQLAPNGPILKFLNNFIFKIQSPCLRTGQIWADPNSFDHFQFKNQKNLGLCYAKSCCGPKLAYS